VSRSHEQDGRRENSKTRIFKKIKKDDPEELGPKKLKRRWKNEVITKNVRQKGMERDVEEKTDTITQLPHTFLHQKM
jgi:hypothetical protein